MFLLTQILFKYKKIKKCTRPYKKRSLRFFFYQKLAISDHIWFFGLILQKNQVMIEYVYNFELAFADVFLESTIAYVWFFRCNKDCTSSDEFQIAQWSRRRKWWFCFVFKKEAAYYTDWRNIRTAVNINCTSIICLTIWEIYTIQNNWINYINVILDVDSTSSIIISINWWIFFFALLSLSARIFDVTAVQSRIFDTNSTTVFISLDVVECLCGNCYRNLVVNASFRAAMMANFADICDWNLRRNDDFCWRKWRCLWRWNR